MTAPIIPVPPTLERLDRSNVSAAVAQALRAGAFVAPAESGVFDVTGPGAVSCLQGLLTNDLEAPGDGAFIFGALLTPKGMILVDAWAARTGATVRCTVPTAGQARALGILQRSIPPRLARVTDRTGDLVTLRVAGPAALALAEAARLPIPGHPGIASDTDLDGSAIQVARASEAAPFTLQYQAPRDVADRLRSRLVDAGAVDAPPAALAFARIVAGWPGLASEVDEKTIPQEVRYDEIGGVSYTKGCYTGQETVSRLHFRGHANRALRGLHFTGEPPAGPLPPVTHEDREVGRVSSLAWVPDSPTSLGTWIGLGVLRHEVAVGATVRVGVAEARVSPLPFVLPHFDPA
jgi:folate-binding protein YgfZ